MLPTILGFVFGAFVGSFLNVCVHRLPRNESVVMPPSRCYACGTRVRWYDNLPLISWLVLRGRCRHCAASFSVRYLVVEAAVALLTALVVGWAFSAAWMPGGGDLPPWFLVLPGAWPQTLVAGAGLVLLWYLVVATLIDAEHTIIPDELTKPMQVLAPGLGMCLPLAPAIGWTPFAWFVDDGVRPETGLILVSAVVVTSLVILSASVPLARFIYGRFCPATERWQARDHRSFAIGVFWFVGATAVAWAIWGSWVLSLDMTMTGLDVMLAVHGAQVLFGALSGWMVLYLTGLIGTMAFRRNAMGFGDVKFLAPIGAVVGPMGVVYTFVLAAGLATLFGVPRALAGKGPLLPFGPFLAAGALGVLLFGVQLDQATMRLLFGG